MSLISVNLSIEVSTSIDQPGNCQTNTTTQNDIVVSRSYNICINKKYTDNPFAVAAIIAHELCHIVCYEKLSFGKTVQTQEIERVVDLLVFLHNLGEFQLRIARENIIFGYFDQKLFERIFIIASRYRKK